MTARSGGRAPSSGYWLCLVFILLAMVTAMFVEDAAEQSDIGEILGWGFIAIISIRFVGWGLYWVGYVIGTLLGRAAKHGYDNVHAGRHITDDREVS